MSDRTDQTIPQSPDAAKLYDAEGRVIRHDAREKLGGSGQLIAFIHEQPVTAAMLAFGLGYFVGKII